MKSYDGMIEGIEGDIGILNGQLEVVKRYSPGRLYLWGGKHLLKPYRYRMYGEIWRNKIEFTVIASKGEKYGERVSILLSELMDNGEDLVLVSEGDVVLYVGFEYKALQFEKMIKQMRG
jgi:hypothetical protein